jgi:AcrR family transcriptional regulator
MYACILLHTNLHIKEFIADSPACNICSMPRKYSMDIRSEAAALRRRRLIDATVEVLGEVGADRLTMDMVAERADAATRTIYNYFPTRQELLSAVQAELLQAFRDTLQLEIPETGEPAERLRQFVSVLFNMYEQQGGTLATLLEFDEPDIRAQVRDMRAWRRGRLEEILRSASGTTLRLPVGQAVAFAFVMTNHVSWRVLREELALTQEQAVETTATGIEAGLFRVSEHRTPGKATARGIR